MVKNYRSLRLYFSSLSLPLSLSLGAEASTLSERGERAATDVAMMMMIIIVSSNSNSLKGRRRLERQEGLGHYRRRWSRNICRTRAFPHFLGLPKGASPSPTTSSSSSASATAAAYLISLLLFIEAPCR